MEFRTGAIVDLSFVETALEVMGVFSTPRIRPTENRRRRIPVQIDAHETMPKRRRRDVRRLSHLVRVLCKDIPDDGCYLDKRLTRVDLRSAIARRTHSPFVLYESAGDHLRTRVVQRRADARCTDVDSKDEFM